ncbi:MAG: NAD(+)/NADH kinase [Thermoprotei archaeon]
MLFRIIYKPVENCIDIAKLIASILRQQGVETELYSVDDLFMEDNVKPDVVVSIGGDGTLLKISYVYQAYTPLILPIPCGRRTAFYENISHKDYEKIVKRVINGEFYIEELKRIRIMFHENQYVSLNEVMLLSRDRGKVTGFTIEVKTPWHRTSYSFDGDGLLIGPSPGSPAYNLSAGGPIVTSDLDSIFITPLHPMELSVKPVIIPFYSKIRIYSRGCIELYIDGFKISDLEPNTEVYVEGSVKSLRVIRTYAYRDYISEVYVKRSYRKT